MCHGDWLPGSAVRHTACPEPFRPRALVVGAQWWARSIGRCGSSSDRCASSVRGESWPCPGRKLSAPMSEPSLSKESAESAISNAMVRILHEFYGKGPARARTYTFDNYVFCVLEDVLTTVERTLNEGGEGRLVRELRLTFEDLMTKTFTAEVELLTGRRVVGYHSQVVFDPNIAFELFVLDPSERSSQPIEVHSAGYHDPGEVGDVDKLPEPSADVSATAEPPGSPRARYGAGQPDGRLRAAISNAMMRVTRDFYGRGPERAKTYLVDDYVFCVLEDLLTTVERTLLEGGQSLLVRHVRLRFHDMTATVFANEIETLTGRKVLAGHSQIVFSPDTVFYVFVLEPDDPRVAGGVSAVDADVDSVVPS